MVLLPSLHLQKKRNFLAKKHCTQSLIHLPPGQSAVIGSFGQISADQKAALRAYGIFPGSTIRVLQQVPVTIVQVEFTELAFERSIAAQISITGVA